MKDQLEVKERIIKTATELFHNQGYHQTGINQIIKEAKVAKASLYYHFSTKDDLCIAFLQERHKVWNEEIQKFLEGKQNKALAVFDFLLENNASTNYRGCSFLNTLSEIQPEQKEIYQELQNHKSELLSLFEEQFGADKKELAYAFYAFFESAIVESQLYRSNLPIEKIKKIATSLLPQ